MASVRLTAPLTEVRATLDAAKEAGARLLASVPNDAEEIPRFREQYLAWESRTAAILENAFDASGFMTTSPKDEFNGTSISLLDLKISATTIPMERLPEVATDIREKIRVLGSIDDRLDVYSQFRSSTAATPVTSDAPIFLVHGRDVERREIVRRFLETVTDRAVVVLADQANRGQDILGKLLEHAQQAAFAVVLLTPDDEGGLAGVDVPSRRARQNVVFELGLFIGLLGRDKVAALNDPGVELPTDFSGVGYILIAGESWQMELARELKAAGVAVSLDKAL